MNWIEILSDGAPDRERLKRRLHVTFATFLLLISIGLLAHAFWAFRSNDPVDFARGGAWLIAASVVSLGVNVHFLGVERWRLDQILGEGGATLHGQFLYRHYIEKSGRFFNGINIGCAVIGALISGYGDIWFERVFL